MRLELLKMDLTLVDGEIGLEVSSKLPNGEKREYIDFKIKELADLIGELLKGDFKSYVKEMKKNDILDILKELL